MEVVITGLPLIAFAELLARDTVERRRSEREGSWGLPPRGRVALLVADRERWGRLDLLLDAVRRHQPHVRVWIGAAELLVEAAPAREATPPLRLARDEPGTAEPIAPTGRPLDSVGETREQAPSPERSRSPMQEAVTPEEIEMLLRLMHDDGDDGGNTGVDDAGGRP
jgi:hypothetical protein